MDGTVNDEGVFVASQWVDIGGGMQMPARSTWTVEYDGTVDLEVVVIAEPGRIRVAEVHIRERDDAGVVDVVVDAMRLGGDVLDVIANAAVTLGGIPRGGNVWGSAETEAEVELVGRVVAQARRNRLTNERLKKVVAAYKRDGIDGVMELEDRENERYAYTLLKKAHERGLIERNADGYQA
jgi:hypothetical protein